MVVACFISKKVPFEIYFEVLDLSPLVNLIYDLRTILKWNIEICYQSLKYWKKKNCVQMSNNVTFIRHFSLEEKNQSTIRKTNKKEDYQIGQAKLHTEPRASRSQNWINNRRIHSHIEFLDYFDLYCRLDYKFIIFKHYPFCIV